MTTFPAIPSNTARRAPTPEVYKVFAFLNLPSSIDNEFLEFLKVF